MEDKDVVGIRKVVELGGGNVDSMDEFEDALIGVVNNFNAPPQPAYNFTKCLFKLEDSGMTQEEAVLYIKEKIYERGGALVSIIREVDLTEHYNKRV
jgi:hypothetical protein